MGHRAVAFARMRCKETVSAECWLKKGQSYLLLPLSLHAGGALKAAFSCVTSRPVVIEERSLDGARRRDAWAAYARAGPEKDKTNFHGAAFYWRTAESGALVVLAENR